MTRRRKSLSEEDRALWKKVAETVTPLHRKPLKPEAGDAKETVSGDALAAATAPVAGKPVAPGVTARKAAPKPLPPPLVPLDRRTQRAIDRGRMPIDARIDLHGLNQEAAHHRLHAFIEAECARGARLVLIITGKGRADPADPFAEIGVLKRKVPQWLALPEFRGKILSVEPALPRHGGAGAYYVRLRREGRKGHRP
ncbi:MAG: Smr/MutS family protein [Hyphomicrobiaceae bacterium]|nr:Smr/MutS family protein [Hyphomicrobiaceae bacterium]